MILPHISKEQAQRLQSLYTKLRENYPKDHLQDRIYLVHIGSNLLLNNMKKIRGINSNMNSQMGNICSKGSGKNNSYMDSNGNSRLGIIQISRNSLNRLSCNNQSRVSISRWSLLKCSKNNISNSNRFNSNS